MRIGIWTGIVFLTVGMAAGQERTADRAMPPAPAAAAPESRTLKWLLNMASPAEATGAGKKEKFREYLAATLGPAPLIGEAAGAGIGQWMNSPSEWGQGWGAFGKRFGSNLAYNAARQTITYLGSVPLGEDDRYFASGRQGFWPRTRHALVSTFTARHADGRTTFSISSTAGVVGAAALSSLWGPPTWKGAGNIAGNAGISFACTAGFNVIREFLPDILHRQHP